MNIVFLCGSLEPGRDGVGDYTRCLATELIRKGHNVMAVALNDSHVSKELIDYQFSDGAALRVLRIASTLPAKYRFNLAKEWIDKFNPEWLSLQFVPFSFHPKGLAFFLGNRLAKLGKGRRWHIMFHELWVGMDTQSSKKYLWWGRLQQKLIIQLLKKLKPRAMHTQTKLYMMQLQKLGFNTAYLPLFSNIPVTGTVSIKKKTNQITNTPQHATISFVLFAAIHAGAPARQFAKDIADACEARAIKAKLIIIGRNGAQQQHWVEVWQAAGLTVDVMGEQPPGRISEVFSNASAGITTTPFALVEKSGAAAAMREHGLPVICVSYPWTPRKIKELKLPDGIIEYPNWDIQSVIACKPRATGLQTSGQIAGEFMNALYV